jgi:glycosyltransferase involved in cell wall biosynthesis
MTTPLVSVVIPCYNLAHVLPRAVASIVEQTLADRLWEVVIVDDASPDDTKEVCDKLVDAYSGYNIHVVHHPSNLYLAGALNTGSRTARGKYVLNLDADNELPIDTLRVLAHELEHNREVDIVYGSIEIVEEDGKRWTPNNWPPQAFDYQALVYEHINQVPSSAMFRHTVWERTLGYRRRCRTGEDAEFWCRATTLGFVPKKVTGAVTLIYYNRADSMSHTTVDWDWTCWMPKVPSHSPVGIGQHTAATTPKRVDKIIRPNNKRTIIPLAPYISISDPIQVSVVIPVGAGHEELLIDAVDSVWAQTYDYWECIVVNDTDHDLPALPPFVKIVNTKKAGSGPAIARNVGMKLAQGKAVVFLDADDFLEPIALATMWDAWSKWPDGYVYSDWIEIETALRHESSEHDCSTLRKRLYHPNTIMVPAKKVYYDEALDSWDDWDYALSLTKAGIYGVRVPMPLVHVRMQSSIRRAQLLEHKEEALGNLHKKWDGVEMAGGCSSCGGRKYTVPTNQIVHNTSNNRRFARPSNVPQSNQGVASELDLPRKQIDIEYTGSGSPMIRGKSTGVNYYFNGTGHVVKSVYEEDVAQLLGLPDFRVYEPIEAVVDAVPA